MYILTIMNKITQYLEYIKYLSYVLRTYNILEGFKMNARTFHKLVISGKKKN
jgi:hypothetical protein